MIREADVDGAGLRKSSGPWFWGNECLNCFMGVYLWKYKGIKEYVGMHRKVKGHKELYRDT